MNHIYDFDLFVIGAGSGGVRAARRAAALGKRVAIAEDRYLGGTCVNAGCIPKKLMMYGAEIADRLKESVGLGWQINNATFSWPTLIAQKNQEILRLNGVYGNLLTQTQVKIFEGLAQIQSAHHVKVLGQTLSAQHILIAVGGCPNLLSIPGADLCITSNEFFDLEALPKKVVVVGGGYIAVEMACIMNALGSEVTMLIRGEHLLRHFDRMIAQSLHHELLRRKVKVNFQTQPTRIERIDGQLMVHLNQGEALECHEVLVATGRHPRLDFWGFDGVDLKLNDKGFIVVDEHYETSVHGIFAIGDVIGKMALTPTALAEAMTFVTAVFEPEVFKPLDYSNIPTAVFSIPPIATVGMTEDEAKHNQYDFQVFESRFKPLKSQLTEIPTQTLIRLIVDRSSQKILGCHIFGPDAPEILQGIAIAIKAGATKQHFDETLGIHPTTAEELCTLRVPING